MKGMILNGRSYYVVLDIWETVIAAPVTIVAREPDGRYTVRWYMDAAQKEYEDFTGIHRDIIYKNRKQAKAAAVRARGKGDV